jgi:hypothetical protein
MRILLGYREHLEFLTRRQAPVPIPVFFCVARVPPAGEPACAAVVDWNWLVVGSTRGSIMGTTLEHRRYAEECVAMARLAEDDQDKMLWLTLAQSWVRLAEHVERSNGEGVLEMQDD